MTRDELKQKKIGVLLGGVSAEREVSLRTGKAISQALVSSGYNVVEIDAATDLPQQLKDSGVEIAFIALHGRGGEDGTVQGLLETMAIPYTGSGVRASSMAIDKVMTKKILLYHELPTPQYMVFRAGDDIDAFVEKCRHFPLIVKPACEGSTIGMTIADDAAELRIGLIEALKYDRQILVEDFIKGSEATVSVLNGEALPIIEIVPKSGFYDYEAKYTAGATEYILPAPYAPVLYERLQQAAVEACRLTGCTGAVRVDFMVREKDFSCLEINTIPGMTATSLLPKAAAEAGIAFPELVQRILEGAGLDK
ncbi:MAG: D-alanine--D-alanine ligase [Desulfuromonas sp.]|nr:MAG: D-alanine--D-alanine ligase [Desulfuromonas sp.]